MDTSQGALQPIDEDDELRVGLIPAGELERRRSTGRFPNMRFLSKNNSNNTSVEITREKHN